MAESQRATKSPTKGLIIRCAVIMSRRLPPRSGPSNPFINCQQVVAAVSRPGRLRHICCMRSPVERVPGPLVVASVVEVPAWKYADNVHYVK